MKPTVEIIKQGYYRIMSNSKFSCDGTITYFTDSEHRAFIVDTGLPTVENQTLMKEFLEKRGLKFTDVKGVIETHGHEDHTGNKGLFTFANHYRNEVIYRWNVEKNCVVYKVIELPKILNSDSLSSVESILGDDKIKIVAAASHTLDDVVVFIDGVYRKEDGQEIEGIICISGDIFFGNDTAEEFEMENGWIHTPKNIPIVKEKILKFADIIICGHGPTIIR